MVNSSAPEPVRKSNWSLTQKALQQLLEWLDAGTDSVGQRYLEIRERLVLYFDRKNCLFPDELADETLNRVARRLEEEGSISIDTPAHYCYIVARFVFMESLRTNRSSTLSEMLPAAPDTSEELKERERRSACLERCMNELSPSDRELLRNYYQGEQRIKIENRKSLATKLRISINALSIRVCRLRDKLETCVKKCLVEHE
jgi:DNA-directed RNA polymerase specialized sigma24 family protein